MNGKQFRIILMELEIIAIKIDGISNLIANDASAIRGTNREVEILKDAIQKLLNEIPS
uniref:Uncharacterized protein n=1 Tax=viral metagenome TaxID=1070528 RepID=A0A6M3LT78_9ZZZZ